MVAPMLCVARHKNPKMDGRRLQMVLHFCVDVVELDHSFKIRIRMLPNSSGVMSCGSRTFQEDGCRMDPCQHCEMDVGLVVSAL